MIYIGLKLFTLITISISGLDAFSVDCNTQWIKFMNFYKKSYRDSVEHDQRKRIFCTNLASIDEHNLKRGFKELEINHIADRTIDELAPVLLGHDEPEVANIIRKKPHVQANELHPLLNLTENPPDHLDYRRDPRVVGPVKDQGSFGACWAFGVTGLMEANEHKWDPTIKKVTQLSEQQLIDCIDDHGPVKKNAFNSLLYVKRAGGLMKSSDYRYKSGYSLKTYECKFELDRALPATTKFNTFLRLGAQDEQVMKRVLASYGPILASIQVLDMFRYSKPKAIIKDEQCNGTMNHQVLIVGYGTNNFTKQDYWIVKNSWGDDYADAGFAYMARNANNSCSIATRPIIII